MSYLPPKRTALGSFGDVADAAVRVVTDPCLPEVARLVLRLHELEQPSTPTAPSTPTKPVAGIGLCKAVPAIRGIVWVRERPWVVPLTAAGVVGGLLWLGYAMGKGDRRPR